MLKLVTGLAAGWQQAAGWQHWVCSIVRLNLQAIKRLVYSMVYSKSRMVYSKSRTFADC